MKNKEILGLLVLMVGSASHLAYAEDTANLRLQDTKNEAANAKIEHGSSEQSINDKAALQKVLANFHTLHADFSQIITDLQGQELQRSSGQIVLQKPQQLRWSVVDPEESLLIADGTTVYNIDPFVQQVTLMDQAKLTNSNPLMLLITDDLEQWQQVTVTQAESVNSQQTFNIVSLADNASISKVVLVFDDAGTLLELRSTDRQQQQNLLTFSAVKYDAPVSSDAFTYLTQPDWIVDDQRSAQK